MFEGGQVNCRGWSHCFPIAGGDCVGLGGVDGVEWGGSGVSANNDI